MIPKDRILEKLDSLLAGNDYSGAKRLLAYWLSEAEYTNDGQGILLIKNEMMGLFRKLGEREQAIKNAEDALKQVEKMGIEENVGAATTYLNCATVFKAFGLPENALKLFERAQAIYERELTDKDERLAGLYNNMGLALVDLKNFSKANTLYEKALSILKTLEGKEPEQAITYLNMATAAEEELGVDGALIKELCNKAMVCMEAGKERTDGHYAFVLEKCATVFGYYGFTDYAKELNSRCRRIYEGT